MSDPVIAAQIEVLNAQKALVQKQYTYQVAQLQPDAVAAQLAKLSEQQSKQLAQIDAQIARLAPVPDSSQPA